MNVISVVGARPNFMKVAPIHRALRRSGDRSLLVHTGQHYDERMSDVFFRQLGLPAPDVHLGVGSGSHAEQTARIMVAFEKILDREAPDRVLVVGDVNSTVACGLAAAKCNVPLGHVEAGLRSGDRRMPEEINRVVTDHLADALFATEQSAVDNLRREGIPDACIHFVGNVMIDTLMASRERAAASSILDRLQLEPQGYVLLTMHRPATVDVPDRLREGLRMIQKVSERLPVVFPVHPRTQGRLADFGLSGVLRAVEGIRLLDPLGYLEFLNLMDEAAAVITDSGGIQEETTFLGVPCLTIRDSTERPVTITDGTNELIGLDADRISDRLDARLEHRGAPAQPALWDGRAAERIVKVLHRTERRHGARPPSRNRPSPASRHRVQDG